MCAPQVSAQCLKTAFQSFVLLLQQKSKCIQQCHGSQIVTETVKTMGETFIFLLNISFDMNKSLHLISVHSRLSHVVHLLFLLLTVDANYAQGLQNFLFSSHELSTYT